MHPVGGLSLGDQAYLSGSRPHWPVAFRPRINIHMVILCWGSTTPTVFINRILEHRIPSDQPAGILHMFVPL